ncbi:MAG: anthranilate phosphoribosyltransferase [Nitriliruptoraceae bacterium]
MASSTQWPEVLAHLIAGEDLDEDRAAAVMRDVMQGDAEPEQIAALLVALRAKGESAGEIAGFVRAMIDAAEPITIDATLRSLLVDVVGTGGDGGGTFNISTVSAIVVAACDVPVAKHGNRAASSLCGSADLLEAWGIDIELAPEDVAHCIRDVGIGFLYARSFHPAMRIVGPVRQHLGIPTVFNVLGPLANPAGAPIRAVGVADPRLAPVMADALAALGTQGLVFRGHDGLDELTTTGPSQVWEIRDGAVDAQELDPRDLGLDAATTDDLRGGDAAANVAIADAILDGVGGRATDVVALNAGAALYAAGVVDSIAAGIERARAAIDDGAARDVKDRWAALTQTLAVGRRV